MTTVAATGGASAAFAEDPTPTAGASGGDTTNANLGPKTAGTAVCTLPSALLTQISGLAATATGFMVVEARDEDTLRTYALDSACKATTKKYTGANPLDPEDLVITEDGTIWVGDIGDKDGNRPHIAIHKIAPGGTAAVPNRMVYTDGPKDAHAFLIDGDGLPIILASVSGKAGVTLYKASKALVPNSTVIANLPTLANKGEFVPEKTGTSNPTAESVVTGAARSADGKKVVIRTLSDAYEWDVPDGDVVKAITTTKPVITPLPDEAQGEAIAYTAEKKFITIGFKPTSATENAKILSYTPFVPAPPADNNGGGGEPEPSKTSDQSWLSKLSFSQLTRIVAAVGVVGLVLAIAGIVGIRRARKRRREEEDEYDDYDEDYDERPRRGRGGPGGPRGGRDEHGYGPRDPQYDDQYGAGYADAGYGANGYPANGYAEAGYGQPAANGYGQQAANGYGQQDQYGAEAYGQQYEGQYGPQEYGGQAGYDGYGQQQYGADQYGADQYGGQQYADPYGAPAPQQYGEYGAQGQQQYGGYGYDEPDPRRR